MIENSALRCSLPLALLLAACSTAPGSSGGNGGTGGAPSSSSGGAGSTTSATSSSSTGVTSSTQTSGSTGGGFTVGPHAAPPQVITYGGAVMSAPKVQLIEYAEDPNASDVSKAVSEFAASSAWSAEASEYGVGALTVLPVISIAGTPPSSLNDNSGTPTAFEKTLAANVSGANPAWGAASSSTIYLFVLPEGTDIIAGGHCCDAFEGYHYETTAGSTKLTYAIACTCPADDGTAKSSLDDLTSTISHELVESATDPYPETDPAYFGTDDDHLIWTLATAGEVADMCSYDTDADMVLSGETYAFQRSWSNAAASAGKNPCVPTASSAPYFNTSAVLPDDVSLDLYDGSVTTKGVKMSTGDTRTIDVQLYSEAATAAWTVTAYDLGEYLGYSSNSTVSLDKSTGVNGDVLHLTIKLGSTNQNLGGGAGFVLVSSLDGQENLSIGAISP